MKYEKVILDIEANNLLEPMLDFTKRPLILKETSKIWCVSLRCVDTNETKMLIPQEYLDNPESFIEEAVNKEIDKMSSDEKDIFYENIETTYKPFVNSLQILKDYENLEKYPLTKESLKNHLKDCKELIAHSGIKYDFPALQLFDLMDYQIGYPELKDINSKFKTKTLVFGKEVKITDTLLWSKMVNPDRHAHGLEYFGKLFGNEKIDFHEFDKFSLALCVYCSQDTNVNRDVYNLIQEEKGGYEGWELPYLMEAKLADMSLKQELFGFHYDSEASERCKAELDILLQERDDLVTPNIPPRPLLKSEEKQFTPPKVKYSQASNRISKYMNDFLERIGAEYNPITDSYTYEDKEYDLYYEGCLKTSTKATVKDLMHIKGYLLELGWIPTEMNNRDLVKDSNKKLRNSKEFEASLDKYILETFNSPFKDIRLLELELSDRTSPEEFKRIFMSKYQANPKKSIYIPTSPPLKVGVDKELCPGLLKIMDEVPFVKAIAEYFTYSHRRNSISGNVDLETGLSGSGYEKYVRVDNRVSTPCDTIGASTSRMTHKVVCNIPRSSSIYGGPIRSLFGCGPNYVQKGYDFSSLISSVLSLSLKTK